MGIGVVFNQSKTRPPLSVGRAIAPSARMATVKMMLGATPEKWSEHGRTSESQHVGSMPVVRQQHARKVNAER